MMAPSETVSATVPAPPPSLLHAVPPGLARGRYLAALALGAGRLTSPAWGAGARARPDRLQALGVQPRDRVATMFTPRPEAVIALLACWLVGAVPVGLNPRYRRDEQRQLLDDTRPKALLSVVRDGARDLSPDLEAPADALRLPSLRFGPAFGEGDLPPAIDDDSALAHWVAATARLDPQSPAVVIFTSGSTGRPKGALITHAGLAFRAHTLHHDRRPIPHVRQMLDLPVNHIGALASGIGVSLVAGGLLVMREQFDPAATLAAVAQERLDVLGGVPPMLARLVAHPDFAHTPLQSVKFVGWGAGPIQPEVLRQLLVAMPATQCSQQYGMTESNGPIVYSPPTRDTALLLETTGRPDPRLQLRIADAQDQPLPAGSEGEVQVRLPHPFAGYLDNPTATAEAFTADGYLRTGDRALLRPDGWLVFRGRSKEMYKSGGYNVYPREVEMLLETHPAVRAAAVLGVDDAHWGQVGHAFIEPRGALDPAELLAWCRERLANYKVPKAVTLIDVMPRTSVEKVDRMALARRFGT